MLASGGEKEHLVDVGEHPHLFANGGKFCSLIENVKVRWGLWAEKKHLGVAECSLHLPALWKLGLVVINYQKGQSSLDNKIKYWLWEVLKYTGGACWNCVLKMMLFTTM